MAQFPKCDAPCGRISFGGSDEPISVTIPASLAEQLGAPNSVRRIALPGLTALGSVGAAFAFPSWLGQGIKLPLRIPFCHDGGLIWSAILRPLPGLLDACLRTLTFQIHGASRTAGPWSPKPPFSQSTTAPDRRGAIKNKRYESLDWDTAPRLVNSTSQVRSHVRPV